MFFTIPQSPAATAPFTQGSLWCEIWNSSINRNLIFNFQLSIPQGGWLAPMLLISSCVYFTTDFPPFLLSFLSPGGISFSLAPQCVFPLPLPGFFPIPVHFLIFLSPRKNGELRIKNWEWRIENGEFNSDFSSSFVLPFVIARAFMPVAIRSLNGYYGFLDSLRSLEMTTVTEQFSILNFPIV